MVFGVIALIGVVTFGVLSRAAARGSRSARVDAIIVAAVMLAAALVVVLGALVLSTLACDESCDPGSGVWSDDPDAWQWKAQAVVALLGFLAIAAALALTIGRRHRGALVAMGAATASFGAWTAFLFAA